VGWAVESRGNSRTVNKSMAELRVEKGKGEQGGGRRNQFLTDAKGRRGIYVRQRRISSSFGQHIDGGVILA
jgi:hypothetical protein